MNESFAWLLQATADREAAERLAGGNGNCHAIAKWQQTVEKAIKAMVAALRDVGVLHIEIGYKHGVLRFVSVLVKLPHAKENRTIQQHLLGLLDQATRAGIKLLDALVPKRPPPGAGPQRNTEYPFVDAGGKWDERENVSGTIILTPAGEERHRVVLLKTAESELDRATRWRRWPPK